MGPEDARSRAPDLLSIDHVLLSAEKLPLGKTRLPVGEVSEIDHLHPFEGRTRRSCSLWDPRPVRLLSTSGSRISDSMWTRANLKSLSFLI